MEKIEYNMKKGKKEIINKSMIGQPNLRQSLI